MSPGVLVAGHPLFPLVTVLSSPCFSRVRWMCWAGCTAGLELWPKPLQGDGATSSVQQPAESWGPTQLRGDGIIPLFLLPLSPSSHFTGSCDLWPNPAREGTQLPWAPWLLTHSRLARSRADCTRVQLVADSPVPLLLSVCWNDTAGLSTCPSRAPEHTALRGIPL